MFFQRLLERLPAQPDRRLSFFEGVRVESKSFPELGEDVARAVDRLRGLGVAAGMRIGLLAPNSYAWIVHDLALMQLRVTSVSFPESHSLQEVDLFERYRLDLLLTVPQKVPPGSAGPHPIVYLGGGEASSIAAPLRRRSPVEEEFVPSITFSTGSSGSLKSLKMSERGSQWIIENFCSRYTFRDDDLFLVFLPLSSYQQRVMVYGCILYGIDFAIVDAAQLFKSLAVLRPTLCLAPPILFHTVHNEFLKGVHKLARKQRAMLRVLQAAARLPIPALQRRIRLHCYQRIQQMLGGRVRMFWTGMAPIRLDTLKFFRDMGIPLFEAYGMNECGPITCNTPEENRVGSVGKPLVPGSVTIAPDGEVIVRVESPVSTGYLECPPGEQEATYAADGIHTGDLGYLDSDGFLYLRGRKKEVIITQGGHKTSPEVVERRINECLVVQHSAVFGNGLPCLTAVVSAPDADEAAWQRVRRHIESLNRGQPAALRVERLVSTADAFTTDNGLLTRNLKLDRRAILRKYLREVEV